MAAWLHRMLKAHESVITNIALDDVMGSISALTRKTVLQNRISQRHLAMLFVIFTALDASNKLSIEAKNVAFEVRIFSYGKQRKYQSNRASFFRLSVIYLVGE